MASTYVRYPSSGAAGVSSLNTLTGDVTLSAGTNITLTPTGNNIEIASSGSGSGDVIGPSSSTDTAVVLFDGTTGKLVKNQSAVKWNGTSFTIAGAGSNTGGAIIASKTLGSFTSGGDGAIEATMTVSGAGGDISAAFKGQAHASVSGATVAGANFSISNGQSGTTGVGVYIDTCSNSSAMSDYWGLFISGAAVGGSVSGVNHALHVSQDTSYFGGNILANTLTASRAVVTDASKNLASSAVTSTELGYVSGVTSAIQTQLNAKQSSLTFSTGLTNTAGTVTVNTSQNIATLSNLTSNGFVKTSGSAGTLSIDTSTYLTGNQTITLSGDVSGSGTTAITTTIGALKVTNGMIAASTIDLTAKVTGVLPIANGGTGASTAAGARTNLFVAPTVQRLTSGTTYTLPTSPAPLYLVVECVGPGGGGAGSSTSQSDTHAGTAGSGATTFGTGGSQISAGAGAGGGSIAGNSGGGAGGTASPGTGPIPMVVCPGSYGGSGGFSVTASAFPNAPSGGAGPFGGAGPGGPVNQTPAANPAANSGSGGGAAGAPGAGCSGGAGGAGGYVKAMITGTLSSTYAYVIGTGGTFGTAGTSGQAGKAGADGIIIVTEHYQ